MAGNYWLMKSEPFEFSIDDLMSRKNWNRSNRQPDWRI